MNSETVMAVPEFGYLSEKINDLRKFFVAKFKDLPDCYVRAPGRVNIIGEHIDYCGYAVFPMAIKQHVLIAIKKREDTKLCISNVLSNFDDFECDINNYVIDDIKLKWYKYVLCGLQGIKNDAYLPANLRGLSIAVTGDIPPGAGLSSSSALVCASALAVARVYNINISLHLLAELCARSERYIGTEGGGMDQAASLLSNAGFAQLIEFNPLRCTPSSLPAGSIFVVANSLVEKNKAVGSDFNTRVVECRLACRMLAKKSNVSVKTSQLGELQKILSKSFSEMVELVKEYLHPQPYSKQELAQLFNINIIQLEKEFLSANTAHIPEFNLYKRALHVFTESSRVWEFKYACDEWSSRSKNASEEEKVKVLQHLGQLMNESHFSAQHLFECSHPQLDKIVSLSKDFAYGARLTGAGWGGCAIALVDKDKVGKYIEHIKNEFYSSEDQELEDWSSVLFSTEPGDGARVYEPDYPKL